MRFAVFLLMLTGVLAADGPGVMKSYRMDSDSPPAADPDAPRWNVQGVIASNDRWGKPQPEARTGIRSRWTRENLYFLFISQYETLHLTPKPTPEKETWGIWEFDVVEVFIGHELEKINLYKEFEVTPQGEFVDLDVDKNKPGLTIDWLWDSKMKYKTRIDRERKIWYCEMQIPWKGIDSRVPASGNELRMNLYRIEGAPPNRKFIAWQKVDAPSYHTPEAFGRLRLVER